MAPTELDAVLAATAVNEVWGVGRQLSKQLNAAGITTVLQLTNLDAAMVRSRWGVVVERIVRELQGTACIELEHAPRPKQEIACTRSFGHPVTELADLNEAVTDFASLEAVKLRKQSSLVSQVLVFIRTSPFRQDAQYSRSTTVPLRRPSADTGVIVSAALNGLAAIYRPGFKLAKTGVMLLGLQPEAMQQCELPLEEDEAEDRGRLMTTLDGLNLRYGRSTVLLASAGLESDTRAWAMNQERRKSGYTTCWADMPVARA